MKYEKYVSIAMPKGELEKPAYDSLRKIGFVIPEAKNKRYEVLVENAPVVLNKIRASDVPNAVFTDEQFSTAAGITGSDILWENGYNRGRIGSEVPVELLFPNVIRPELYLGVTKAFADDVKKKSGREVIPTDLSGKRIYTKYATVASDFMSDNQVKDVDIAYRGGGIEGWQYIDPLGVSLVDIWVSGNTARDNQIIKATTIAPVVTTLFENTDRTSAFEQRVIDDIRERLFVEAQKIRPDTTSFI